MYLYSQIQREPLLHLCVTEPLRRGTADVLRQSPRGLLALDRPSGLYLLTADGMESAAELLEGMEDVGFIMLLNAQFEPLIERFHLKDRMRCHQAGLLRGTPPPPDPRLKIEAPDGLAFARILQSYHMDTPEELRRRRDAGELFFARDAQRNDVGFVGLHPEGCFGMLEVFPEQRGKGYGAALESHILRFCLENGRVPYCQVEVENAVSLNLQRKLGLEISPETSLFAWNCKD